MKKKIELAVIPTENGYTGQEVRVSGNGDNREVWLNPISQRSTNSVCMSPDEAILLAKMIYKAAYAAGYGQDYEDPRQDD